MKWSVDWSVIMNNFQKPKSLFLNLNSWPIISEILLNTVNHITSGLQTKMLRKSSDDTPNILCYNFDQTLCMTLKLVFITKRIR